MEELKFPIGKFTASEVVTKEKLQMWIEVIKFFPEKLLTAVEHLHEGQLENRYRPQGWTIRQIIHHCADSHMNSLIRFKLALTEDTPTIKPYAENLWAELPDNQIAIESSIKILQGVHERWTKLLENLTEFELERQFRHPESGELISLKQNIGIYAWHCSHHLAHILLAKNN